MNGKLFCVFILLNALGIESTSVARIVGGVEALEGQFPYQVSVRHLGEHYCGGSIISRNYVLTAAHCLGEWRAAVFYSFPASEYNIRGGSTDRLKGGSVIPVAEIIFHGNYENFLNDIALLKLQLPLIYSANIQSITLARGDLAAGTEVTISGWGLLKDAGLDNPKILQWTNLTTITRSQCKEEIHFDSDSLLCLSHEPDVGACHGDSGGPAVSNDELVGVANFVYFGCGYRFPDVYAKVCYHLEWIKQHADL